LRKYRVYGQNPKDPSEPIFSICISYKGNELQENGLISHTKQIPITKNTMARMAFKI
jgi:hypothetical protein